MVSIKRAGLSLFERVITIIERSKDGKTRVLSLSYGKDSMACLGAIEKLGWPLDRIITAELWATDDISADLPPMVEFKEKADKAIRERYGIDVTHVCAEVSYQDLFYKKYNRGKKMGKIRGFAQVKGNWCTSELKSNVMRNFTKIVEVRCCNT